MPSPAFIPSLPLARHALPSKHLSCNPRTRPPLHPRRHRPASSRVPKATTSQPLAPPAAPPPPPTSILTPATARPALIAVAVLYGSLTVIMRVLARPSSIPSLALPTLDPLVFNILRLAVSSILSIAVLLRSAKPPQTSPSPSSAPFSRLRLLLAGLELGAWNAGVNIAMVAAVASAPAPRVAFLVQTQTILVPLASLALALRPPRDRAALASAPLVLALAALALVGSALLSFDGAAVAGAALSAGDAAALCAALCATLYVLRSQAFIRTSLPPSLLTSVKNIAQASIATAHLAITAPAALALPSFGPAALALNAALVVYGGVCVNFIGAGVQMASLEHVPASDAALIFAFAPVVTAAIAAAVMGEVLGLSGLVGAAMILAASIATVVLGARKKAA